MIRINKRSSRCSQRPPPQLELRRPQFSSQEPGRKRGRTEGKAAWGQLVNFPYDTFSKEKKHNRSRGCVLVTDWMNCCKFWQRSLLSLSSCSLSLLANDLTGSSSIELSSSSSAKAISLKDQQIHALSQLVIDKRDKTVMSCGYDNMLSRIRDGRGSYFFHGAGRGGERQGKKSTGRGGAGNPPFPTMRGGAGKGSKSAGWGGAGAGNMLRVSADWNHMLQQRKS